MADLTTARLPGAVPVLATQVRYQLTLLIRNPRAFVAGLVLPGCLLALERGSTQHITMAQAAPKIAGLVAFSVVAIAFFTHANALVIAREEGLLRRWHASPLPAWAYFTGKTAATMLVAAASGLILVLVAVAMTGVHLTGHAVVGLLGAGLLAALALAAAATAASSLVPSAQAAQPLLMLIYIPLIILSGAFGPVAALPSWLSTTMTYLPAEPLIDAASRVLQHGGALIPAHDLAVLTGWAAGGLLTCLCAFRWNPHRPARGKPAGAGATAGPART
jgi:ABC-2 type transport system permease protein